MKKQSIWKIVFEFLSIVFAVLLALGLNSYKQNFDLKKESKVLTEKILIECRKNLTKLDTVIYQNQDFRMYLDSVRTLEKVDGFRFDFSNELLSSSAWQFTQVSRSFQLMDQSFLDDATELYEVQNYYMDISNQMFQNLGDMIMKIDEAGSKNIISTSHYYLTNILQSADQLQKMYRNFLEKHEGTNNSD